jgi:hypothetical protein
MDKRAAEWLKQADYDMGTAEFMAKGGRYFYAVFMCHLAIEKALKGLYEQNLHEIPPKTHNLLSPGQDRLETGCREGHIHYEPQPSQCCHTLP